MILFYCLFDRQKAKKKKQNMKDEFEYSDMMDAVLAVLISLMGVGITCIGLYGYYVYMWSFQSLLPFFVVLLIGNIIIAPILLAANVITDMNGIYYLLGSFYCLFYLSLGVIFS